MEFLNSIISWFIKKRLHQIDLFRKYPCEVQRELLLKLTDSAKGTEWGKKYDYYSLKTMEEFKNRVPLQDYESIKPYISRMKKGEQNLLWPTEIKWFAKSSGTTSDKSKFIPVSNESLEECHYKGGKDMLAMYLDNRPDSKLFSGKGLVVGGANQINPFNNDSYYGDLSAIIIKNLPFWVEYLRTPDLTIALMAEWEEKLEKMARSTMQEDVSNITGVPSWTLVLLKRILEITGKNNIMEVWPNLELYIHGGVSFTPYRDQFKSIIPFAGMNYLETYNASEGFFGIQDDLKKDEMLLMLDYGIYYEFLPMADFDSSGETSGKSVTQKTVSLEEVEINTNYALIISTNAGLWRYNIGDTIRFTSLNPFKIQVTGRTKSFINAFGEELIRDNAEKALEEACLKTGAVIREYTAAPVFMSAKGRGGHEWLIEFELAPGNLNEFSAILDKKLKSVNSDYEAKRHKDLVLLPPLVRPLPAGTFYSWLKKRGKLGGQNKIQRLSNDRRLVDEILLHFQ